MPQRKSKLNTNRMHPSYLAPASGCQTKHTTTMVIVGALGVFVFAYLCMTLKVQPLFPFQNENLEWCRYRAPLSLFRCSLASLLCLTAPPLFFVSGGMCENDYGCDVRRTWLYMTVVDFYGSTLAMSAVVAWSESAGVAVAWILLMNLLGSPFACAYVVYRVYKHKTLALASELDGYNGIHP